MEMGLRMGIGMAILNARPHPVLGGMERWSGDASASGCLPQIPERSLWKTFHVNVSQQKWQLAMHTSLSSLAFYMYVYSICLSLEGSERGSVGVDVTNATCMTNQLPIQTDYEFMQSLEICGLYASTSLDRKVSLKMWQSNRKWRQKKVYMSGRRCI